MIESRMERRQGVRLTSKLSSAAGFTCEHCGTLPDQALVADISDGGVHLLFEWPEDARFPLQIGDGIGFHLKVEGESRGFEIWSIVYRIDPRDRRGRVGVGVKFLGLDAGIREQLKKVLVSLAMTKLRVWRTEGQSAKAGQHAPGQPANALSASEEPEDAAAQPSSGAAGPEAPSDTSRHKLFLGEILLHQGALDPARFEQFLKNEFSGMHPIGQELVQNGLVDEVTLARALAEQARLPFADPDIETPDLRLASTLPRHVFMKHHCVPLGEQDDAVILAMSAPPGPAALEEIRAGLGRQVRVCVAPEPAMAAWRRQVYNTETPTHYLLRFPAQLRAEYRFLDSERKAPVDDGPSFGLTREISASELLLVGPLPGGVSTGRIAEEALRMDIQVDCPSLNRSLTMGCTPQRVEPVEYEGEHHLHCQIDHFPDGNEQAWVRTCMVQGARRFRPQTVPR
jgi:hypothetical protein